jgi:hypothetical protein
MDKQMDEIIYSFEIFAPDMQLRQHGRNQLEN